MNRRTWDIVVPTLFVLLIIGIRVGFGSSQVTNWAIAGGAVLIGLYWVVFRKNLRV